MYNYVKHPLEKYIRENVIFYDNASQPINTVAAAANDRCTHATYIECQPYTNQLEYLILS